MPTADAATQTALSLIEFPSTSAKEFATPTPSPASDSPPLSPSPFPECKRCGADLYYCDRMDRYFCLGC